MIKLIVLTLFSEMWHTAGQILFKKATTGFEAPSSSDPGSYLVFFRNVALAPAIWFGFTAMALSVVFWLMALTQGDLSLVYPLGSAQYIATMIFARFILKEKIDLPKVVGTFLVAAGIIVIAQS